MSSLAHDEQVTVFWLKYIDTKIFQAQIYMDFELKKANFLQKRVKK